MNFICWPLFWLFISFTDVFFCKMHRYPTIFHLILIIYYCFLLLATASNSPLVSLPPTHTNPNVPFASNRISLAFLVNVLWLCVKPYIVTWLSINNAPMKTLLHWMGKLIWNPNWTFSAITWKIKNMICKRFECSSFTYRWFQPFEDVFFMVKISLH